VRVLTWAILFEQSASRTCAELTKLKVGMAKSAVLATKQRPLGALLGAYKAEEPAQCNDEYSAKRTNLPPTDIESWSRTGNVVGGTGMGGGTALIVGSASLAFLLVATPAAPLGLGILVAGGLAGIVCATGASVVGMIADGQGDKELSAWKEAIRSGGTDSMGMAEYSIDGVMVGLTWEQRKDLVAKMFSLARPQTAGRTGYSLTNLAVMWYACRENFPTFLDRIRIDFAQSAKFWSLTELEAASLSYGTEKGLRVD
ncbi:MAG: hypothetical protein KDK78_09290, partial [Chlamydiia bacterium]|nr:hypothetical protein [Chlamydiia bacterium]